MAKYLMSTEVLGLGNANTNQPFEGRWVLVTGGASGIGLACADHLACRGAGLMVLDVDAERLEIAAAALRAHGGQVRTLQVDVTDTSRLEAIASELDSDGIQVSGLITAAGVLQPMLEIELLQPVDHDRVWAINYHASYHCCRIWGQRMRQIGRGSIVTVSSITALRATPLLAYGPAKAALDALTASLSVSYAASGVRINAVAPGFTRTEALEAKIRSGQRDAGSILAGVPMARFVEPDEVASAVAFLLSDAASAITGVSLPVDAGWLCGAAWATYQPLPRATEPARVL